MKFKKIFLIALIILLNINLFCQSKNEDYPEETQVIYPTKKYSIHQDTKIEIIYYPYIDEARVIYYVPKQKFTQDESIIICRNVLVDFMKEHHYYHYIFLRQPDQTIYSWKKIDSQTVALVKYIVFVKLKK